MGTIRDRGTNDWYQRRADAIPDVGPGRRDDYASGQGEQTWVRPGDDSSPPSREREREREESAREIRAHERARYERDEPRERVDERAVDERPGARSLADRIRSWRRTAQAGDLMTRHIRGVRPNDSVQHVAQIMVDEDTGIVPVVGEGNRLLGIVTDRDIVCRLIPRNGDVRGVRAGDVMSRDVECVTEQTPVHGVLQVMRARQVRRVPVVARGDRLVGIISMADLVRAADGDRELLRALQDVSTNRGGWSRAP